MEGGSELDRDGDASTGTPTFAGLMTESARTVTVGVWFGGWSPSATTPTVSRVTAWHHLVSNLWRGLALEGWSYL